MFKVIIHRKALNEINAVSEKEKRRLLDAIRAMGLDPFSGDVKPIKSLKGVFRRRVGDYRIAFTVNFEASEVVILRISRRGKFYAEI
jgi:mRNA-degrading endonuclease RelE of RelBE toxin-antitoxin system